MKSLKIWSFYSCYSIFYPHFDKWLKKQHKKEETSEESLRTQRHLNQQDEVTKLCEEIQFRLFYLLSRNKDNKGRELRLHNVSTRSVSSESWLLKVIIPWHVGSLVILIWQPRMLNITTDVKLISSEMFKKVRDSIQTFLFIVKKQRQ